MGAVALWHVTYDNLVIFFQVQVKLILVIHNPSDPLEGLTNKLVHDLLYNDFVSSAGVAKSHANAKTKTYFRSPPPPQPFLCFQLSGATGPLGRGVVSSPTWAVHLCAKNS